MIWPTRFQAQRHIRLTFTPALAARHRVVRTTVRPVFDPPYVGWTIVLD